MIQEIIARQERTRVNIRNWLVTLQAGVAIAYLSDQIVISAAGYALIAVTVLLMFLLLEALYSVAERRAVERGNQVEEYLRSVSSYDGPHIGDSLVPGSSRGGLTASTKIRLVLQQTATPRILFGYLTLVGLVVVVAVAGS